MDDVSSQILFFLVISEDAQICFFEGLVDAKIFPPKKCCRRKNHFCCFAFALQDRKMMIKSKFYKQNGVEFTGLSAALCKKKDLEEKSFKVYSAKIIMLF